MTRLRFRLVPPRAEPESAPALEPASVNYGHRPWELTRTSPIIPGDTDLRMRAQSILSGSLLDGRACPTLTLEEAQDVLRWHRGYD